MERPLSWGSRDPGLKSQGLSVILTESDLSHSQEILDMVYTIDRGEVSVATV